MNGTWLDTFQGIIPRHDYTVRLSAGEEKGLIVLLESENTSVTITFGAVSAFQMLDEGVLLQGEESEQLAAIRKQNFPSTIYQVKNADFGRFIQVQMGAELYTALQLQQYNIITYNYVISVASPWEPEIAVTQK